MPKNVKAALYISKCWYDAYLSRYFDADPIVKRYGLLYKLHSVIVYDRILNGYKANGTGKLNTSWAGEFNGK